MKHAPAVAIIAIIVATAADGAVDFSDCADALDRLGRAARDASESAEETESEERDFEYARDEYESCRTYPEMYDFLEDGCRGKYQEAEWARSEFESAIDDLQDALDSVDRRIRSVSSSCGDQYLGKPIPGVMHENQRMCVDIRGLARMFRKSGPLPDDFLKICVGSMSEAECKACIANL